MNERSWQFWSEKEEKRPYWINNFSCILHIRRKITRRPAGTGIFLPDYKFSIEFSIQRALRNINSTTDFCTLCKRVSRFSVKILFSRSTESFRRRTLLCFIKLLVSNNLMAERREGRKVLSRFSVKFFLSLIVEKFRRGTF